MGSLVGSFVTASTSYLPTVVQDMWTQSRSFATCKLPSNGVKTLCGFATIRGQQCVVIAASDGFLYVYGFDGDRGGQCSLIKQHQLDLRDMIRSKEDSVDTSGEGEVSMETYATVTSLPPPESENRKFFDNSLPGSPLNYSGEFPSIQ